MAAARAQASAVPRAARFRLINSAAASDGDLPANSLTYSLSGGPAGAAIDPATGAFSWTPTEAQGPGTYTFDVMVSDGALTDTETITVDPNHPLAGETLHFEVTVEGLRDATDEEIEHGHPHGPGGHHH